MANGGLDLSTKQIGQVGPNERQVASRAFPGSRCCYLPPPCSSRGHWTVTIGLTVLPGANVSSRLDQGYGRGGTPTFTSVFEPVARVTLYLMDENGLGTCFGAA